MNHISLFPIRALSRFVTCCLLLAVSLAIKAIPNYGTFTDGRRIYDVRGRFDTSLSFFSFSSSSGDKGSYFSLTSIGNDVFLVDSLESQELVMPPLVHPGDTVFAPAVGEFGLFFIDSSGRLYASMRHCRGYEEPGKVRRCDSLSVLYGYYSFSGDGMMQFTLDQNGEPQLIVCSGAEGERISFCKDVVHNGRPLMHIRTPQRRWLIELTPAGMNVYSAVWSKARRQYVRGLLLRRAKLVQSRARMFEETSVHFPLIDILYRYYTKSICRNILNETEKWEDGRDLNVYTHLFQRLESGMDR